jgi:hypothetical protein
MPLNKEIAQDLIDDFVLSNDDELNTISTQNPALFDATLNALTFLSGRFGTGQKMQIVEKPKVVQEIVQGGLPFKEGDKFIVPSDVKGVVYNLTDIDLIKGEVKVSWYDTTENKTKNITNYIINVTQSFNDGNWVLVGWYPLKVGYKFINKNNKELNYTILNIDESKNKGLEVMIVNKGVPKVTDYEISDFIDNIELGFFIFVKDELSFKVGDIFRKTNSNDKGFKIKEIDGEKFVFESLTSNMVNDNLYTTTEANKRLLNGNWEKIETISQPTNAPIFQEGQILFDINEEELFEIYEITTNGITLKSASGHQKVRDSVNLEKKLGGISYVLASYKIDDVFTNKEGDIYTIYQLSKTNKLDVDLKLFHNGIMDVVSKNWDTINTNIYDGVWIPLIATQPQPQQFQPIIQPQTTQDNPHNIKIGDLILRTFDNVLFEVLDVNLKQDTVKLMTSSNYKVTEYLSVLNIKIDDDDNEKLAFSMFDTFVNPNGDFYKIMELYPNNEKSVYVKVNDKNGLEIFQWDIIQAWIEDTFWMPATKAEADQIKADVLKAEEEAKAPKKKLTKLQKQIIDLQQEIDGLLFLADEDADAKAELEKKLIQIEGLKAKKP